jgi:hypothetical protein
MNFIHNKKGQTNIHTRIRKLAKKKQKNTSGNVQNITTCKKRQKSSEADSFRNIKVKISYILEDGHVGQNIFIFIVIPLFLQSIHKICSVKQ